MNTTQKRIFFAIAETALLSLATLMVPLFLVTDILCFDNNVSETSLTEVTQEVLLFASAAMFGISAWRRPEARGFLVLACGLFACMFVRELDALLDRFLFHGSWVWLVAVTAAASITCARTCRGTVVDPIEKYIGTKSQIFVLIGMVILLVFGRIMGSGNVFWRHIVGRSYTPLLKNSIQESLEFFGYILIFYGSCLLLCQKEDAQGGRKNA